MLYCSIVVHVHLLHPVQACGLIAGQFAHHPSCEICEGKKPKTESTISVTMTWILYSRESSCLANYIKCPLSPVFCTKKLMFVPIASVMAAVHRDCLVVVSDIQWLEIQPLVS